MNENLKRAVPQLLVAITDADRRGAVADLLGELHLRAFQCRARGTATSEIMDILGLAATGKTVTLCLTAKELTPRLLARLRETQRMDRAGGGIAFTLPCSGIASPLLRLLEAETRHQIEDQIESEVILVKENATHDLILAVVNQGFSEELVEHAKGAGATGGTVLHASQMIDTEKAKSWGIALHDEKEIVLMLVPRELRRPVMQAAGRACGITTEARGLILSLPVDEVEGLGGVL